MQISLKTLKNPITLSCIHNDLQIAQNGLNKGIRTLVFKLDKGQVYVELYNRKSTDQLPVIEKHTFKNEKLACEYLVDKIQAV